MPVEKTSWLEEKRSVNLLSGTCHVQISFRWPFASYCVKLDWLGYWFYHFQGSVFYLAGEYSVSTYNIVIRFLYDVFHPEGCFFLALFNCFKSSFVWCYLLQTINRYKFLIKIYRAFTLKQQVSRKKGIKGSRCIKWNPTEKCLVIMAPKDFICYCNKTKMKGFPNFVVLEYFLYPLLLHNCSIGVSVPSTFLFTSLLHQNFYWGFCAHFYFQYVFRLMQQ